MNYNSLWITFISVFLLALLIISRDPYTDPGFAIFSFVTLVLFLVTSIFHVFTSKFWISFIPALYSVTLVILSFLRLLSLSTFISSTLLFVVLFVLILTLSVDKNKNPTNTD